ncbi:receptor-like protein kinase THESEUS 1 [Senna tora]|uniref:Receptor-like protein kinase THESEUS 1 n=1 Tax=Senna tora TaxID=362788 RepID=A0A834WUY5_9FABA|nr:receptor-like protein kinase THESEUS 1 [Senna tora]
MNPDKCFPSPLFLAIIIIFIIIIVFVNYYSCAATTTTFTPIDNYLIACGSSQNITFAGRTFIADSQHSTEANYDRAQTFIHNIYTSSARQEPVENPKQSRARDFPHLPPNQTLPLPRRRRLLLLHSPEALLCFLRQDLLQRDDDTERSDATRRRRREICLVAMDPPSMVRVFAPDESVSEVEREREKRPINLLG